MCARLAVAHAAGKLAFFGAHAGLEDSAAFAAFLKPLRRAEWVVYAKAPFAGPDAVLAYLARYTHRVAISNSRLVAFDGARVSFRYKDYRVEGEARQKLMTVDASEFIRRFLLHVLPDGFHRIRHYGFLANGVRVAAIARARALLSAPAPEQNLSDEAPADAEQQARAAPCPCCGGRMILVERVERGPAPHHAPTALRIDSS